MVMPPNEWAEGQLKFTGKITIRTENEEALTRVKAALKLGGGGEVTNETTAAVTEWFKGKVETGAEKAKSGEWSPKVAVSALLGGTENDWEVGLQVAEFPIFAKLPSFRGLRCAVRTCPWGSVQG
jgi:hypothetical protein